jgi:hypothetical protein
MDICNKARLGRLTSDARAKSARACEAFMTTALTIAEIEQAINYWCARQAPEEDGALCARARPLADVYGWMIYERVSSIPVSRLTPEQMDAIRVARYQRELSL